MNRTTQQVAQTRPKICPTCESPQPWLHPAVQHEGEVQPCKDRWHALEHTPGPWTVKALPYGENRFEVRGESLCITFTVYETERTEANARLIAAAPELLEALKGLVEGVTAEVNEKGGGGFLLARLTDARAAISKAETGQ